MMGKWTCVRSHGHCQHMAKDASPSLRWASSRHPPQHIVGPLTVKDRTPVEWILVLISHARVARAIIIMTRSSCLSSSGNEASRNSQYLQRVVA
ncbi:hypothetical protein AB1N83_010210 [Pleurotus pulmonarius]